MVDVDAEIASLQERLRRYPPERYPVQHAIAAFHLGRVMLDAGRLDSAAFMLDAARALFGELPVERAKCENLLGVVWRDQGRFSEAGDVFRAAAATFEHAQQPLEQAAATFNLGLAHLQRDNVDEAAAAFAQAASLFENGAAVAAASAANRELGGALLLAGRADEAAGFLAHALALAEQAADDAAAGSAANALGLAQLATGRTADAVSILRRAVAFHPRSVRTDAHAMAKANLALAYEQSGESAQARLAARQVVHARTAPPPVAGQASAILERLGRERHPGDDLRVALQQGPPDRWPALLRDECARWAAQATPTDAADADDAGAAAGALVLDHAHSEAFASAWVGVLLELPPETMEWLLARLVLHVAALQPDDQERARRALTGAVNDLPEPQWLRTRDVIAGLSAAAGLVGWP